MSPKRKKRKTLFVIFAGPQQHGGPGTHYIATDGTVTSIKSHAAKFYIFSDAKEFPKRGNIPLDASTYIGQEDFTDFEIQMGS